MENEQSQQEQGQTENSGQEQAQEENKQDQSTLEEKPKEPQHILKSSKILDAYEYFLRQLAKQGLPQGNPFEFAALQIENYEKKIKGSEAKQQLDKLRKNRRQYSPVKKRTEESKSPDITQIKQEQEETQPEKTVDISQNKTEEPPAKGKGGKAAKDTKKKK